jgi:Cobalamin adenosyltransferase
VQCVSDAGIMIAAVRHSCFKHSMTQTFRNRRRKIYTKTGDAGTSSLYSGARRQKDDVIFHALGDVDELNSAVGVSRDLVANLDPQLAEQVTLRLPVRCCTSPLA